MLQCGETNIFWFWVKCRAKAIYAKLREGVQENFLGDMSPKLWLPPIFLQSAKLSLYRDILLETHATSNGINLDVVKQMDSTL